jgi:hypothetical protein
MRTIKFLGWGQFVLGQRSGSAVITAKLNDQVVFDGSVELTEQTVNNQTADTAPVLFSFDLPLESSGLVNVPMTVEVKQNTVRFGQIVANYTQALGVYADKDIFNDVAVKDADGVEDPRSNVTIDGIEQKINRTWGKGTWQWTVKPGQVFACNLTFSNGEED